MVNILVVDDEEKVRKSLLEALCSKHNVDVAENGLCALEKIDSNGGYQKVITDFSMPKMNGFELMEELREKRNFQGEIYIISSREVCRDTIKFFDAKFYQKPDSLDNISSWKLVTDLNSI